MKKRRINHIIGIIIAVLFICLLLFARGLFSNLFTVGTLNTAAVRQIAITLGLGEETVFISDPDEVAAILACFQTDVYAFSPLFDRAAIGGCGGYHWEAAFQMRLIGEGESILYFADCDSPMKNVEACFIEWSAGPLHRLIYEKTNYEFCSNGYDTDMLEALLSQYVGVAAVH